MKKVVVLCAVAVAVLTGCAQTKTPAYVGQGAVSPVDVQIEAVRQNYETVKAQDEARVAEQRAAQAEAAKQKAKQQAAEAKAKAARQAAAAKEKARLQAREEKYQDQVREMELEMQRLRVRSETSKVKVQEAVDGEKIRRADEMVDVYLKNSATQNQE